MTDSSTSAPKIGVVLGSGASRGWSHIGILRELVGMGIEPDIVCGCSIGAVVGAAYAAGNLDALDRWVHSLSRIELTRFFELNLSLNGFVAKERLQAFFEQHVCAEGVQFEDLDKRFATVSTDLETGKEVWFQSGPVLDAVWASISLPGLFPPIQYDSRWLVDGGLVNPVPISLCRALGADVVIAVNLNGGIVGKHFVQTRPPAEEKTGPIATFKKNVKAYSAGLFGNNSDKNPVPGLFDAISGAINITQDRITRSRMAGDPPDVLLLPRLSHIGLLEFYRAEEAIREGRKCVRRVLSELADISGVSPSAS